MARDLNIAHLESRQEWAVYDGARELAAFRTQEQAEICRYLMAEGDALAALPRPGAYVQIAEPPPGVAPPRAITRAVVYGLDPGVDLQRLVEAVDLTNVAVLPAGVQMEIADPTSSEPGAWPARAEYAETSLAESWREVYATELLGSFVEEEPEPYIQLTFYAA